MQCKTSCPLYPQKRTCAVHWPMSALGQKRTSYHSFDRFVRDGDHARRNSEAERLGRGEIDNKLEFG